MLRSRSTHAVLMLLLATLALPVGAQPAAVQDAGSEQTATEQDGGSERAAPSQAALLHAPFTALLARHVSDGRVDYTGLAKVPGQLDTYLVALGEVDPAALPRVERMAFWINAYNAFTLRLILDHLPDVESIKDISRADRWNAVRWEVSGKRYSLDQIEHQILRPMGDARIHFALVCAARSCPDLSPAAYLPETLDSQLDAAGTAFLSNRDKGLRSGIEAGWFGNTPFVHVSAIFDWFEEDFERDAGSLVEFLAHHAPAKEAAFIREHRDDLDVDFLDYDWDLNR